MPKQTIMESKRHGTCNTCRGEIVPGDLITWSRTEGANHYRNPDCVPVVATEEQKKAYLVDLTKAVKAWDGKGSFFPKNFGSWLDDLNGRR